MREIVQIPSSDDRDLTTPKKLVFWNNLKKFTKRNLVNFISKHIVYPNNFYELYRLLVPFYLLLALLHSGV